MITIKRARQVVDLVTDLALKEQYTEALKALDAARASQPTAAMEVGQPGAVIAAAARVQEIEAAMVASTMKFTIEAVPRVRWNEHVLEHPPREGNDSDAAIGIDVTSLDLLLPESIKAVHDASGTPVDFDPVAEWPDLSAEMSDGQFSDFILAVLAVNRGSDAPKSKAASLVMRSSAQS